MHEVSEIEEAQAAQGFDVSRLPLIRPRILQLGEDEFEILMSIHHIVVDKWSMAQVLLPELAAFYRARLQSEGSGLPEALPFSEAAAIHATWRSSPAARAEAEYWRKKLTGMRYMTLPTDRPRAERPSYEGTEHERWLGAQYLQRLHEIAAQKRVTPFMVLLVALAATLRAWSGRHDIQVMTPCDSRLGAASSNTLGCLINMLILRMDCESIPTWSAMLDQARQVVLEAYANQHVPFQDLLQGEAAAAQQGAYAVLNYIQGDHELHLDGCDLESSHVVTPQLYGCDLDVFATERRDGINLKLRYRAGLWKTETMDNFTNALVTALDDVLDGSHSPIDRLTPLVGGTGAS